MALFTAALAGKRALINGGSRGIGAATTRRLAAQGPSVAVNYRTERAAAETLVRELRDNGLSASALQADVSDPAQSKELVASVVSEFGGLHLLANNAGAEDFWALDTITESDYHRGFPDQCGRTTIHHPGRSRGDDRRRAHRAHLLDECAHGGPPPHRLRGEQDGRLCHGAQLRSRGEIGDDNDK